MKTDDTSIFEKSPLLAEIEVSYKTKRKDIIKITSSKDAFNVLYPLFDVNTIGLKEEFFILLLNRANNVLGWFKLSSGGTTGTVVDPKLIFMLALKTVACSVILCHNHPSGNLKPSDHDISLTKRIKEAGKLLEISLLDHLIVTPEGNYHSFADEGLI
jgi:DNA repair protein RadC